MSIIYTNDTPTYDFKCRLCHMILWETINYYTAESAVRRFAEWMDISTPNIVEVMDVGKFKVIPHTKTSKYFTITKEKV